MGKNIAIETVHARAYTIPTDAPEADGTIAWDSTTLVLVEVQAGGKKGLGYSYTDKSAASLINAMLGPGLCGRDALSPPGASDLMRRAVRNVGGRGLAAMAISAADTALWDLKAKLLELPLCDLFGRRRDQVYIYGSGGFTSYDDAQLCSQLSGWVEQDGCRWVKMKVGTHPDADAARVRAAKAAIGEAALFVDANGAYSVKQALRLGMQFADEADVRWFEEPVSSDDLAGLAFLRERLPARMEVAAGEYGWTLDDVRRMLEAQAVDVMQADATRIAGFTGFLAASELSAAHHIPFSGHCAPALHLHAACAARQLRHLEWFHDHVRIEHMLFDGAPKPENGQIAPDRDRPGHGLIFKEQDAEAYRA